MNWILFLKRDGEGYQIIESGSNIVPTGEYDKVLPTTERIARQSDKVFFDGENLKLKDGEVLKSIEELNQIEFNGSQTSIDTSKVIFDIE